MKKLIALTTAIALPFLFTGAAFAQTPTGEGRTTGSGSGTGSGAVSGTGTASGTGLVLYCTKDGNIRYKRGTGTVAGQGVVIGTGTAMGTGRATGEGTVAGTGATRSANTPHTMGNRNTAREVIRFDTSTCK